MVQGMTATFYHPPLGPRCRPDRPAAAVEAMKWRAPVAPFTPTPAAHHALRLRRAFPIGTTSADLPASPAAAACAILSAACRKGSSPK